MTTVIISSSCAMWSHSILLLAILGSVLADTCPDGFTLLSTNKCVKLVTEASKHSDATAYCTSLGGNLISVHSVIDNNAYQKIAAVSATPYWLGIKCTQSGSPKSCLWDDQSGDAGRYNGFAPGFPLLEIGSCVYVPTNSSSAGKWLSGDCNLMSANFICETTPIIDTCTFQYNGNCYYPSQSALPRQDAQSTCLQECGNLVSIHSVEENNFVQSLFTTTAPTFIWIGAKHRNNQNLNYWIDGSSWDYDNIGYSNPNLGICWSMTLTNYTIPAGKWISSNCDTSLPFVCKRTVGTQCGTIPVPTPAQCTSPMFLHNSGTFYSPNWPNSYLGEQYPCNYILDTPIGSLVQIRFPILNLDSKASISLYNHVEDSTPFVVLKANSASDQWYTSTTNTMRVVFQPCISDCLNVGGNYNWEAEFKPSTAVTTQPPITVTPNPNNPSGCNSYRMAPGYISSPNYPNYYPSNALCRYHLSTTVGNRINLDFGQIDTDQCCDYIYVQDGAYTGSPFIANISGTYPPHMKTFQSTSNLMLVTFKSAIYDNKDYTGFSANFRTV